MIQPDVLIVNEIHNIGMRKSGKELFTNVAEQLNFNLLDFWSWSQSNLLDNTLRGVLAEFIVAKALSIKSAHRVEWDAYDLITNSGLKIEVKSSAYIQSWKQKKLSNISFGIQRTRGWNSDLNEYTDKIERQADVYVFCVLHHQDEETVNPMNMDQWTFYVLETIVLNEKCKFQKTIGLNSLLKLKPVICSFKEVSTAVEVIEKRTNYL